MVRGIDRQNQEEEGNLLQASSSGGLNLMSSALSIPLADSPNMGNTEVNQRGNVQKRLGSQTIATLNNQNGGGISGAALESIKLRNLPSIVVGKFGVEIKVFTYQEETTNNFRNLISFGSSITFESVFSERARYVKPDTVQTSELEPRLIMTTGVNPPVQAKFVQSISFDITYDSNNDESTVDFENSSLSSADSSNIFIFDDGVDISGEIVTTSLSGNTFSVTVNGDRRNSEMSVVFVSWQWWAEASAAIGNKLYQRVSRFNSKDLDKIISLPTEVLTGIRPLANITSSYPRYPLIPTQGNSYGSYGSPNSDPFYDYTTTPSTATEYVFTQSGQFNLNDDTAVLPGLSVIAFGDIRRSSGSPTDEIEPLHFHRGLPVLFNGARGVEGQNLRVLVGDTIYSQNTDATTSSNSSYYLKADDGSYYTSPITAVDKRGQYIDFTADDPTGVNFTDLVQAVHRNPKFLGAGAKNTGDKYGAGTWIPAFGFWEFCDYQEGSFPRTVAVIQGRLVFGGTPKQPLRVAVSEVFDALEPGNNFQDYQTLISDAAADEAFQFDLQAELNDKITAMKEFNNQLFIFTNNSTFRLTGGNSGLSPTNYFVQFQVGIGCVNPRAVERIENTMYFMSQTGIYDIAGTQDASEYASAERSLKVRELFDRNLYDEEAAWMRYDPSDSRLYVGLSSALNAGQENNPWTAEKLLVYNVFRNAWTQYESVEGRFYTVDGVVITKKNNQAIPLLFQIPWLANYIDSEGSPEFGLINALEQPRPVDNLTFNTLGSDQTASWTLRVNNHAAKRMVYTLEKGRYFYPTNTNNASVNIDQMFSLLPHREIEDVKVEIDYDLDGNYQRLTFNEDFVKFENGAYEEGIYLLSVVPDNSKQIRITKLAQPEDNNWSGDIHPVRVWIDNILLVENSDYVINFVSGQYEIEFKIDASQDAVVEYGLTYDTWFYSPKFFRANMANAKRFTHWYGYFYNEPYNEVFAASEANSLSGQNAQKLTETYKTAVGFNLVFNYDDTYGGYTSGSDIYGTLDLFWDTGLFDISSPQSQFNEFARVSEPIIGASYNFQVGLLCNRATFFEQVGYQVTLLQRSGTRDKPNNAIQDFKF